MTARDRLAFRMEPDERRALLERHQIFSFQTRKRFLAHFDDLEGEANEVFCEEMSHGIGDVDDDRFDGYDLLERSEGRSQAYLESLKRTQADAHLSIAMGMFHLWEKSLKEWLDWKMHGVGLPMAMRDNVLHVRNIDQLTELLDLMGWGVVGQQYWKSIDRCRLAINTFKHGAGTSAQALAQKHPDLFRGSTRPSSRNFWKMLDPEYVNVRPGHLEEFSRAFERFWRDCPEVLQAKNPQLPLPKWLTKGVSNP